MSDHFQQPDFTPGPDSRCVSGAQVALPAPRVCLDVSAAVRLRAGIGRYAQELAAALAARTPENEYCLFLNHAAGPVGGAGNAGSPAGSRLAPALASLPLLTGGLDEGAWRARVAASHLLRRPQDALFPHVQLLHATDHLLPRLRRVRSVFTLHDLAFHFHPETLPARMRIYLRAMMPRFLSSATRIVADSEATQRDAVRIYRIPESRIRVVYPGVHERFERSTAGAAAELRRKLSLPENFLLYLGGTEPRKNLRRLLEAFRALKARHPDLRLVLAGAPGPTGAELLQEARAQGLEGEVRLTGYIADEDLPSLYSAAAVFVYPSLYEGFGLPVLEAMACGTPVVCADVASLHEVAGETAVLVDPRDPQAIAAGIARVLADPRLRATMSGGGRVRARRFTWERTAREMLVVYREALQQSSASSAGRRAAARTQSRTVAR